MVNKQRMGRAALGIYLEGAQVMRISVLVTLDTGVTVPIQRIEKAMMGMKVFDNTGSLIGIVGFAAIPLNRREFVIKLLAHQIEADGAHLQASEPYRMAGDALVDAALDLVP